MSTAMATSMTENPQPNTNDDICDDLLEVLRKEKWANGSKEAPHDVRRVLQKWKDGGYAPKSDKTLLVAFILSDPHAGSCQGIEGLKGPDAKMARCLLPIAKRLGFSVCLTNIKKTVTGIPRKTEWAYRFIPAEKREEDGDESCTMTRYYRGRYEKFHEDQVWYQNGEYDTPRMGKILEVEYELSQMHTLVGNAGLGKVDECNIDQDYVIPKDRFDGTHVEYPSFEPDEGEVIHEYDDQPCLVIFRDEDETNVLLSLKDPISLLKDLKPTSYPTPRDRSIVDAVLEKLEAGVDDGSEVLSQTHRWNETPSYIITRIIDHALEWKDVELWNRAIHYCGDKRQGASQELRNAALKALSAFGFTAIEASLETIIRKKNDELNARVSIIEAVSARDTQGVNAAWINRMTFEIFASFTNPSSFNPQLFMPLVQRHGYSLLLNNVLPNLARRSGCCGILMSLANALHDLRSTVPAMNTPETAYSIHHCVLAAAAQWDVGLHVYPCSNESGYQNIAQPNSKTSTICNIVQFAYKAGDLWSLSPLMHSLSYLNPADPDGLMARFKEIHIPLIPQLHTTLADCGAPAFWPTFEPFSSFLPPTLARAIELFNVVASQPPAGPPPPPQVSLLNCRCPQCKEVDAFVRRKVTSLSYRADDNELRFKLKEAQRKHIEVQVHPKKKTSNPLPVIGLYVECATDESTRPHTLVVRRRQEVLDQAAWKPS